MAKVQVLNEAQKPLANVIVEARLNGRIVGVSTTNNSGIANFPRLSGTSHSFHPRITRYAGKVGEMSLFGAVHVSVIETAEPENKKPVVRPGSILRSRPTSDPLRDEVDDGGTPDEIPEDVEDAIDEGGGGGGDCTDGALRLNGGVLEQCTGGEYVPLELSESDPGGGQLWMECPE